MTLSFEQVRAMVEDALLEQYPPVARGNDKPYEGACRFYVQRIWTDKALVRRSYYSLDSDPLYGLVTYVTRQTPDGDWEVTLDAMIPMKLQAVSEDGKTSVQLETENKDENITEAGKRNSKRDASAINAATRTLISLLTQEDLDDETVHAINKLIFKPNTRKSETVESDITEAWNSLEGDTLTETFVGVVEGTFDKKNLIVKDHVVLGPLSKNGYRYPLATQQEALKNKVFEGAKAYLNHPVSREMGEARDIRDLIGEHRNLRINGEKTYSDLYLVNNRTVQDHVLPIAESAPHLIGSSVVIRGKMKKIEGDLPEIETIYACRSIDLVSEPATTNGLYESERKVKEEDMELKDLTLEQLKTRPDLIEAIMATAKEKEQIVDLQKKLDESTAQLKESEEKRVAVELKEAKHLLNIELAGLVEAAKIPDSAKYIEEENGRKVFKPVLLGILERCNSEERVKIIADWEEAYKTVPVTKVPVVSSQEQKFEFDSKTLTSEATSRLFKALVE